MLLNITKRLLPLAACALVLVAASASGAQRPSTVARYGVPNDFLGIVDTQTIAATPYWKAQTLATQRRSGIELQRQDFDWAQIEPRPGIFRFGPYDALMMATARAGMHVLAILDGPSPAYAATRARPGEHLSGLTVYPPRSMSQFASFAAAVARRYGPGGSFWRSHPQLPAVPITSWEIWNEPNFDLYWGGHPSAASYASMLRAAVPAIHAVDPRAEIVTAGVANTEYGGIPGETYIEQLLAIRPRAPFDTLAVHAYAQSPAGVIDAVKQIRMILDIAGRSSTPIWLTEFGWASGGPSSPFTVGSARQANYVFQTIMTLARDAHALNVRGLVYYDWQDEPAYAGGGTNLWGFHTGLVDINGIAKQALSKYYQAAGLLGALRH